MLQVVAEKEVCLKRPKPRVFAGDFAASSVNNFCRPCVRTDDYCDVLWELAEERKLNWRMPEHQSLVPSMMYIFIPKRPHRPMMKYGETTG